MKYTVSKEEIGQFFHLPLEDAAKKLGVCASVLKRSCRQHGIKRWPYRKIKSLDKKVSSMETAAKNMLEQYEQLMSQISEIEKKKKVIATSTSDIEGSEDDSEDDMELTTSEAKESSSISSSTSMTSSPIMSSTSSSDDLVQSAEQLRLPYATPLLQPPLQPRIMSSPNPANFQKSNEVRPQIFPNPLRDRSEQRKISNQQVRYSYAETSDAYQQNQPQFSQQYSTQHQKPQYATFLPPMTPQPPLQQMNVGFQQQQQQQHQQQQQQNRTRVDTGLPGISSLLSDISRPDFPVFSQYKFEKAPEQKPAQAEASSTTNTPELATHTDILYRPFTSYLSTIQAKIVLTDRTGKLIWYADSLGKELPLVYRPERLGEGSFQTGMSEHAINVVNSVFSHQYRYVELRLTVEKQTFALVINIYGLRMDTTSKKSRQQMMNLNSSSPVVNQFYQSYKVEETTAYMWFLTIEQRPINPTIPIPHTVNKQTERNRSYVETEINAYAE